MLPHRSSRICSLSLLAMAVVPAMEQPIVGPRALGMGGTGVACAEDYPAQWYNPAAFGFFATESEVDNQDLQRKDWGLGVDVNAGYRVGGDAVDLADKALKIDVNAIKQLSNGTTTDTKALQDVVNTAAALARLDPDSDVLTVNSNAGAGLRIGSFGLGFRMSAEAITGLAGPADLTNVGINLTNAGTSASVYGQLTQVSPTGFNATGYTPTVFSQAQIDQLSAALVSNAAANGVTITNGQAQDEAYKLDFSAAKEGVSASDAAAATTVLVTAITNATDIAGALSTSIENNTTAIRFYGFGLVEVPLTWGQALGEHWSIGGNVKFMHGRVYGLDARLINSSKDNFNDYFGDLKQNYRATNTIGIDAGILGRWPMLQVGLAGRNLNAPKFKGPELRFANIGSVQFEDVRLSPEFTVGGAFIPWDTVTLALDLDLTRAKTVRPDYRTQYVRAGFEWNPWHVLALRAGMSRNLAEHDIGTLYHAGIGLNLYLLRLDLAAAATPKTDEFRDKSVNKEARVGLAVATDW